MSRALDDWRSDNVSSESESDEGVDLWACAPMYTRTGATIAKERSGGNCIPFGPVTKEQLRAAFDSAAASGRRRKGLNSGNGDGSNGLKFKFFKTDSKLVRATLESHGFQESRGADDWHVLWAGIHLKPYTLQSLGKAQRVNHFPRTFEITRKDRLYQNISRMREVHGIKHFGFIPHTFSLPSEFNEFYAEHQKDKYMYWIVKPNTLSRGRGIYITNNINEVPVDENCVISKYIQNPLLVDGFKFDIRLYVCITSFSPLRFYLHEEGLVRFATERFSSHSRYSNNAFMHLTNYSINKKNSNFVSNEDAEIDDYGNKWSLSALRRYFERVGIDHHRIWEQMEDIVTKTLISIESSVHSGLGMFVPHPRTNCFELLGFDILLDDQYRAWLLEVNLSPSLSCDSPLDHKIKTGVVADMFNLIGLKKGVLKRATSATYGATRPTAHNNRTHVTGAYAGEELNALRETADEWVRSTRTGFIRVFPSPSSHMYTSFFEKPRRLNTLLREWFFPGPAPTRRSFAITAGVSYSRQLSHGVRGVSASGTSPSVMSTRKRASTAKKKRRHEEHEELALAQEVHKASQQQYHAKGNDNDNGVDVDDVDDVDDDSDSDGQEVGRKGEVSTRGDHFGLAMDPVGSGRGDKVGLGIVPHPTRSASAGPGRTVNGVGGKGNGGGGSSSSNSSTRASGGKGKQRAPSPYLSSPAATRPSSSTAALTNGSRRVKSSTRPQSGLSYTRNGSRDSAQGSRSRARARVTSNGHNTADDRRAQGTQGAQSGNGRLRRTASYAYGAGSTGQVRNSATGRRGAGMLGMANGGRERVPRTRRASSASRRVESSLLPAPLGPRAGAREPAKSRRSHIPKIVHATSTGNKGTSVPYIGGGRNSSSQDGRSKAVSSSTINRFKSTTGNGQKGLNYAKLNLSDLTVTPNRDEWDRVNSHGESTRPLRQGAPMRGSSLPRERFARSTHVAVPEHFRAVVARPGEKGW